MEETSRFDPWVDALMREVHTSRSVLGVPAASLRPGDPALDLGLLLHGRAAETPIGVTGGGPALDVERWLRLWLAGARTLELDTDQAGRQELRAIEEFSAAVAAVFFVRDAFGPGSEGDRPTVVQFRVAAGGAAPSGREPSPARFQEHVERLKGMGRQARRLGIGRLVVPPLPSGVADETELFGEILLKEVNLDVVFEIAPTFFGREAFLALQEGLPPALRSEPPPEAFQGALPADEAVAMIRRLQAYAVRQAHELSVRIAPGHASGRAGYLLGLRLAEMLRARLGPELVLGFAANAAAEDAPDLLAMNVAPVLLRADAEERAAPEDVTRAIAAVQDRMRGVGARNLPDFVIASTEAAREAIQVAFGEVSDPFRDARADWPEEARESARRATDDIAAAMLEATQRRPIDLARILNDGVARLHELLAPWIALPAVDDHLHRVAGVRLRTRDLAGAMATPEVVSRVVARVVDEGACPP